MLMSKFPSFFLVLNMCLASKLPHYIIYTTDSSPFLDSLYLNATVQWLSSPNHPLASLEVTTVLPASPSSLPSGNGSRTDNQASHETPLLCPADDQPSIHLSRRCLRDPRHFRFPAITFLLRESPPTFLTMGFGHSDRGLLTVAKSVFRRLAVWPVVCLSDVLTVTDGDNLNCQRIVRNGDGSVEGANSLFVHCSKMDCYRDLKVILRRLNFKMEFTVVLTEDVADRVQTDLTFWDGIAGNFQIFGIKREFPRNQVHKQLYSILEDASKCIHLSRCPSGADERILGNMLYLHDAILVMNVLTENVNATEASLRKSIADLDVVGAAGQVIFDPDYLGRIHPNYEIIQVTPWKHEKVGWHAKGKLVWIATREAEMIHAKKHLERMKRATLKSCNPVQRNGTSKRRFRITTVVEHPFLFYDPNNTKPSAFHKGDLTGYIIDFAEKLAEELDFTYDIFLVPDGKYGSIDVTNVTANGMMGQILRCEVDLALAPITITATRQEFIDFTKPWMDVGLSLLAPKPAPQRSGLFAFMNPFTNASWVAIIFAWLLASISIALLQYVVPLQVNHLNSPKGMSCNCQKGPSFRLRAYKAIWYLYATAMQQGPEGVRQLPAKIAVGGWFFFALITISTYTANLAAFLTVSKIPDSVSSVDQLARQTDLTYGTVSETGVEAFFKNSDVDIYSRMSKFMSSSDNMVTTADDGVKRVRNGSYAFIWDSPIVEYFASQQPCNATELGRKFNEQGYGIAMPRGMPYLHNFTVEILKLRGSGWFAKTKKRWLDSGECSGDDESTAAADADQVGIEHMVGVYIVLGFAIFVAFAVAILLRFLVGKKKESIPVSAENYAVEGIEQENPEHLPETEKRNGYKGSTRRTLSFQHVGAVMVDQTAWV